MTNWDGFAAAAPRISAIFHRRHLAADKLCLIGTLRADGYPRVSPIEPRCAAGELFIAGIPQTAKLRDLERDNRFTLHTATTDNHAREGDAKVWGRALPIRDAARAQQFAQVLFEDTGIDLRGHTDMGLLAAEIVGASAVAPEGDQLNVLVWKAGHPERVARQL